MGTKQLFISNIRFKIRGIGAVGSRINNVLATLSRALLFDLSVLYTSRVAIPAAQTEQGMRINNNIMLNRGCMNYVRNLLHTPYINVMCLFIGIGIIESVVNRFLDCLGLL